MTYKPTGINKEVTDDISYLTSRGLLYTVDRNIPKPYSAGQNIFSDPDLIKLVESVNRRVWPEVFDDVEYIERTKGRAKTIGCINFSTKGLYVVSILASVFRSKD